MYCVTIPPLEHLLSISLADVDTGAVKLFGAAHAKSLENGEEYMCTGNGVVIAVLLWLLLRCGWRGVRVAKCPLALRPLALWYVVVVSRWVKSSEDSVCISLEEPSCMLVPMSCMGCMNRVALEGECCCAGGRPHAAVSTWGAVDDRTVLVYWWKREGAGEPGTPHARCSEVTVVLGWLVTGGTALWEEILRSFESATSISQYTLKGCPLGNVAA